MPTDEEFFNAEFFKFVNKTNRFLKSEKEEIIYFKYEKSGFLEVGVWNESAQKGNFITTNIFKKGAVNENLYSVSED
jgi:hypothetical protein